MWRATSSKGVGPPQRRHLSELRPTPFEDSGRATPPHLEAEDLQRQVRLIEKPLAVLRIGSSPNRVGRKSRLRALKPLDF